MSNSLIARGLLLIDQAGMPVVEESQQGRYALVFLKHEDVICYRQQLSEIRSVPTQNYQITAMPIHQLKALLNLQKIRLCIIENWDAIVA